LKRSRANGWVVVSSHVDDRHGNVRRFQTMPQLDARTIAKIDVEKDANRLVEFAMLCESLRRGKQQACVAKLPQQSRYAFQDRGVVIDDQDKLLSWQAL
jgi:hypothetical protein